MSQSFAQISDPHLSSLSDVNVRDLLNKRALGYLSWRNKRRHEHRREVLDALQRDLQTLTLQQVLVTGDLTHIGLPTEFQQARDWLRQLGTPADIALIPGNHDSCVAAPWDETYALWADYLASDPGTISAPAATEPFPSLRRRGDVAFIGLSSACPTPPLMATGNIDQQQLQRLPALLDQAHQQGLFRVVYLHHSPLPGHEKWRKRLRNTAAISRILIEHGAELVLHGHGHRARHEAIDTCHGTAPVMAVPSASALGLHGKDSAAYNTYTVQRQPSGWDLQVCCRRYQRASGLFNAGETLDIALTRPAPPPSPESP